MMTNQLDENNKPLKTRILLVEDDFICAKTAQTILRHLNCNVDLAKRGDKAIDLNQSHDYDLIFMDIHLPDMTGYDAIHKIRQQEQYHGRYTPIVVLTAYDEKNCKQRCFSVMSNWVTTKPLVTSRAQQIIDSLVPKSKKLETFATSEKIIDVEYMKGLMGDNQVTICDTLILLAESLSSEKRTMEQAYQKKNWAKIGQISHKLKGDASYCGALRLQSVCTELSNYIRNTARMHINPEQTLANYLYQKVLTEIKATSHFLGIEMAV